MRHPLKIALLIVMIASLAWPARAAEPDWAYPKRVVKTSESRLDKALKAGRDAEALQALIDLNTAELMLSQDNLPKVWKRLDDTRAKARTPLMRQLVSLLKARTLTALYDTDSRTYQQRNVSGDPSDPCQWSARQMADTVKGIIRSLDLAQATPIDDFAACLTLDAVGSEYFPTMGAFMALRALRLCRQWDWLPEMGLLGREIAAKMRRLTLPNTPSRVWWCLEGREDELSVAECRRLYDANSLTPYACDILLRWPMPLDGSKEAKEYYAVLKRAVAAYPTYYDLGALRQRMAILTRLRARLAFSAAAAPGEPFPVDVATSNAPMLTLKVYRLNDSDAYRQTIRRGDLSKTATLVQALPVTMPGEPSADPWASRDTLQLTFDRPGQYAITAMAPGMDEESEYVSVVQCSAVTAFTVADPDRADWMQAVNPHTGAPVAGVLAQCVGSVYKKGSHTPLTATIGTTDADGLTALTMPEGNWYDRRLRVSLDDNTYYLSFWPQTTRRADNYQASGYTSLPLYHPGDEMRYTFVAARQGDDSATMSLADSTTFALELLDANGQTVDKKDAVSDAFGRLTGAFTLPKTGLTGRFTLRLLQTDGTHVASTSFMVSDYKMPSIRIDSLASIGGEDVTITAAVSTYTGLPVAGANAAIEVRTTSPWRWWRADAPVTVYSAATTADSLGCVSFTVPGSALANAGTSYFQATVSATASNGETQQSSTYFSHGRRYMVLVREATVDAGEPYRLAIDVREGNQAAPADLPMAYTLTLDGKEKACGTFQLGQPEISLSALPAGRYTLTIQTADTALCEAATALLTLYDPSKPQLPVDAPLWTPVSRVSTPLGRAVKVPYGAASDDTYIYWWLRAGGRIADHGQRKVPAGYGQLEVNLPPDHRDGTLTMVCVKDLKEVWYHVDIETDTLANVAITAESMRDVLTPGMPETWRLRVAPRQGTAAASAVMIDLYNQALDALAPTTLAPLPWIQWQRSLAAPVIVGNPLDRRGGESLGSPWPQYKTASWCEPDWRMWGKNLGLSSRRFGTRPLLMMKSAAAGAPDIANDALTMEDVTSAEETQAEEPSEYREIETPLALYRPMLTTDADGALTLSFTTPNANAAWALTVLAWDKGLQQASLRRTFTASKPLMVKSNPPRYLRCGDIVRMLTTVTNATDTVTHINVYKQTYDPVTGDILTTDSLSLSLGAHDSQVVTMTIGSDNGRSLLGYRIKASNGSYTDGEQAVLPVLSSIMPVVESEPFCLAPDQPSCTLQLKRKTQDAKSVLEFTTAPQWYVVTALPGLRTQPTQTVPSAAAKLFAAAVGRGLAASNPAIVSALEHWTHSDGADSTLVSMLSRNASLKTALLSATPWMADAENDTERMSRLHTLLNPQATAQAVDEAVETLTLMARPEGGWAWAPGDTEASRWATLHVLDLLGQLREMSLFPDDNAALTRQVHDALMWLDRETVRQYRRHPKTDYTDYAAVRTRWRLIQPSAAAREVIAKAVAYAIAHWRDTDKATQASWALMLADNGYHSTAENILRSLEEYTESSPQRGIWLPCLLDIPSWSSLGPIGSTAQILQAFARLEPSSPMVSGLTQWLILQKQATSWGNCTATTQAIAAILHDGDLRLAPASSVTITRGNEPLPVTPLDSITGYVQTPVVLPTAGSVPLTVSRSGTEPSYGSLFTRYRQEASLIQAASIPDLSIDKTLAVWNAANGMWSENADTLRVGDRVQVTLRIRCQRPIDYVAVTDQRPAAFEPVDQLPGYIRQQGLSFYRENRDADTNLFITHLPKGTYVLTYDLWVNNAGRFTSGIATIQSQYAPAMTAHSAGSLLMINE